MSQIPRTADVQRVGNPTILWSHRRHVTTAICHRALFETRGNLSRPNMPASLSVPAFDAI